MGESCPLAEEPPREWLLFLTVLVVFSRLFRSTLNDRYSSEVINSTSECGYWSLIGILCPCGYGRDRTYALQAKSKCELTPCEEGEFRYDMTLQSDDKFVHMVNNSIVKDHPEFHRSRDEIHGSDGFMWFLHDFQQHLHTTYCEDRRLVGYCECLLARPEPGSFNALARKHLSGA